VGLKDRLDIASEVDRRLRQRSLTRDRDAAGDGGDQQRREDVPQHAGMITLH
jgi:hypothetical protein